MSSPKKLILVIGATGAQGRPVVSHLLKEPTPYAVRALTRDPTSKRAQALAAQGVELFRGSFDDYEAVKAALEGCYGAFVNTDTLNVGEAADIYIGIRIFELAMQTPTLRHYVYSSLDNLLRNSNYNPLYTPAQYMGKARVADWMRSQETVVNDKGMTWSILSTGIYMEMLQTAMTAPLNKRADGTYVFASAIGDGHAPFVAVEDIGWWARYSFDHRAEVSGKELEIVGDMVGWDYLVETFTRVTGIPAVYKRQTFDEWWNNFDSSATSKPLGHWWKTGVMYRDNFTRFWSAYRDDIIKRDMDWILSVHPGTLTLEKWMRKNNYRGEYKLHEEGVILKDAEDGKMIPLEPNREVTSKL
ncbi:nmrA-family protein [Fistulina hepatica ATCC 64428]|uniref:NmrA-family protein n=1 Tax=Fistulina hepatica ATCC 64428 TaxID=1128425 RepID=A0A0D7A1G2_9AGAR|nr:nmrA-family protein [Fistulina hepatica ATCC 64428]